MRIGASTPLRNAAAAACRSKSPTASAAAEFAELIRRADEKRRGVNQPDILPMPPQPQPRQVTAEEILGSSQGD